MSMIINNNEALQQRLIELKKWNEPECDLLFALINDLLLIDYNDRLTNKQLDKISLMINTFHQKDLNRSNTPFDDNLMKLAFEANRKLFAAVFEKHEVVAEDLYAKFAPVEIVAQNEQVVFHWVTIAGNYIVTLFQ